MDSLLSCYPRGKIKITATNTNQNQRLDRSPGEKIHEAIQQIRTFVHRLGPMTGAGAMSGGGATMAQVFLF